MTEKPVLEVSGLRVEFKGAGGWHAAVRDVSFDLRRGEILAVVGESGSGKSVSALSILGLLPESAARVSRGNILLEGRDLTRLDEHALSAIRGNRISMIFQEPMTSLNPTMRVGDQIIETIRLHRHISRGAARTEALRLLREVRIPSAETRIDDYPHRFSGGMRQRVMIAMALASRPDVLLADEPTTALDVTIQAQILALIAELRAAYGMSILFITHNLGVVASIADRVAVMYAGEIVECAPVAELFAAPRHPYTRALIAAVPRVDRRGDIEPIPGSVPPISDMPKGCAFAARCDMRRDICELEAPRLERLSGERLVRCPPAAGEVA